VPIILATQETEVRRITLGSIVRKTLTQKKKINPPQKKGWWSGSRYRPWVQAPVPSKIFKKSTQNRTKI
jgi:hypothetical protein